MVVRAAGKEDAVVKGKGADRADPVVVLVLAHGLGRRQGLDKLHLQNLLGRQSVLGNVRVQVGAQELAVDQKVKRARRVLRWVVEKFRPERERRERERERLK